jgi:hypothetical protein
MEKLPRGLLAHTSPIRAITAAPTGAMALPPFSTLVATRSPLLQLLPSLTALHSSHVPCERSRPSSAQYRLAPTRPRSSPARSRLPVHLNTTHSHTNSTLRASWSKKSRLSPSFASYRETIHIQILALAEILLDNAPPIEPCKHK